MKKLIVGSSLVVLIALIACGGNESKPGDKKEDAAKTSEPSLSDNPVYQKGLSLVAQDDCATCHQVDNKFMGPSYREIANKYANASAEEKKAVAQRIINGSTGIWGTIQMTKHSSITPENAEAIVDYILLLKK